MTNERMFFSLFVFIQVKLASHRIGENSVMYKWMLWINRQMLNVNMKTYTDHSSCFYWLSCEKCVLMMIKSSSTLKKKKHFKWIMRTANIPGVLAARAYPSPLVLSHTLKQIRSCKTLILWPLYWLITILTDLKT